MVRPGEAGICPDDVTKRQSLFLAKSLTAAGCASNLMHSQQPPLLCMPAGVPTGPVAHVGFPMGPGNLEAAPAHSCWACDECMGDELRSFKMCLL